MADSFSTNNLIFSLILSFIFSMGLGVPAARLAEQFGIIDIPNSAPHKKHTYPTPLAGGFLILFSLIPACILFQDFLNRDLLIVFSGALIIFLFGLWDDANGLSAVPKLIGQIIASLILVLFNVQVQFMTYFAQIGYISFPLSELLNILITFFWLIGITNALNMIDSMDGIVAGLGVIAFAFFMAATILSNQFTLTFWSAVLLSISVALYFWNGVKSRFFLGDSGAQTIGFLLASFSIMYNPLDRNPESSWIVPIMLLGIPIFDTTLVVLSRFKRKQAIGSGRRDHTYHRLIALGLSPRYAVFINHFVALVISSLAYLTLSLSAILAFLFFFTTILSGIAVLLWLERQPTLDE
jgi:UDP-GlcNAc:undecaprenyl-phosphate GlcNAc-1-phosphate transferase